ncbi:MAG: Serine phosphatase RsbU, regulator of sigma subunit [uncultured Friedmanniella sp.]|uniref:Serine phosphatase RsbU, regulator of sigma subunit n=1 Tax=uncultured Friedmanniella sp. TaxID=335381 RepID=A0A6J4LS82_9ACTN|nr:GAF domain-containing protein [uncultured Friedmanniella sp.]CAA9339473.1 MAG: Serine phosphatase RsbU, regulator of sigma subunit [uncultured Friedmanniella sp.]
MSVFPHTGLPSGSGNHRPVPAATAATEPPVSRLRRLLHESGAVVEELSLPSLHRRVVQAAVRLVPLRRAALAVLSPDGVVLQLLQQEDDPDLVASVALDSAVSATLTELLQPLAPRAVSRLGPERASGLPEPWSAGFAATPVHHRSSVLAVLLVLEPADGLSTEDEDLLLSLSATAGTAIENARLYEEARRRQEWLQEAADLSGGTMPVTTEDEAVELIAHSVHRLADAELVAAWVPGGQGLRLAVGLGDRAADLASLELTVDDQLIHEVSARPRGRHLDATPGCGSGWLAAVAALDIGPVMLMPVLGGSRLRGLLLVGRHVGRPGFVDVDLDMVESFAGHVTMALDLIRARAAQERLTQLEDRERIARDLHDHVASLLLATGVKVQASVGLSRDSRVHHRLHEVLQDIDVILHRLRSSIFPVDPPAALDEARFAAG